MKGGNRRAEQKSYHAPKNQRLDAQLYAIAEQATFVTIRAFSGSAPFTSTSICQMVITTLNEEQDRQGCIILAYCLMPDHLHYLIRPSADGISVLAFTNGFKGKTTNRTWRLGWQGKLWEPRCYDHLLRSDESLSTIAEYILHNPVRKGLVQVAEAWAWSGFTTEE